MARKKKVGPGRRPKREGERLSKNRTFRVRGSLDENLIRAAAASGRSVSEEIEHRLEASFQIEAGAEIENKLRALSTQIGKIDEESRRKSAAEVDARFDKMDGLLTQMYNLLDKRIGARTDLRSRAARTAVRVGRGLQTAARVVRPKTTDKSE